MCLCTRHDGRTVSEGEVQVFEVKHPKTSRLYAWLHATEGTKRRVHVVLGVAPVRGAQAAVRLAIAGECGKRRISEGETPLYATSPLESSRVSIPPLTA